MSKYVPRFKTGERHREKLIKNALLAAEKVGYQNVDRAMVCDHDGISRAMINIHIGGLEELRNAIKIRAVMDENIPIIAQMLVFRDPFVRDSLTPELLKKVRDYIETPV